MPTTHRALPKSLAFILALSIPATLALPGRAVADINTSRARRLEERLRDLRGLARQGFSPDVTSALGRLAHMGQFVLKGPHVPAGDALVSVAGERTGRLAVHVPPIHGEAVARSEVSLTLPDGRGTRSVYRTVSFDHPQKAEVATIETLVSSTIPGAQTNQTKDVRDTLIEHRLPLGLLLQTRGTVRQTTEENVRTGRQTVTAQRIVTSRALRVGPIRIPLPAPRVPRGFPVDH